MTWKQVGISVAYGLAIGALMFAVVAGCVALLRVEGLKSAVVGLQRQMAAPVSTDKADEAMSVIMTDDGDLQIRIKAEGKNLDPKKLDWAVLDAVTARVRNAMPKEEHGMPMPSSEKEEEQPLVKEPDCGSGNRLANPSRESQDNRGWMPVPVPQRRPVAEPRPYYSGPWQTVPRPQPQPRRLEPWFYQRW